MGNINPIRRGSGVPESRKAEGVCRSAATAAKVNKTVELPVVQQGGLRDRQWTPLKGALDLSKSIRRDWNLLHPEELAERIIDLEARVASLKEPSPLVDKVKKQLEHFHFRFVFPVALELESPGKAMPPTFASETRRVAKQLFQTHSLQPFHQLNSVQQREVIRFAEGRGA
ncbi:MAG: hypothetical protein WCF19_06070 [Chlamydiales bacterium]